MDEYRHKLIVVHWCMPAQLVQLQNDDVVIATYFDTSPHNWNLLYIKLLLVQTFNGSLYYDKATY